MAEETDLKRNLLVLAACCMLAIAMPPASAQDETEKAIEKYRQMLKEDPWSNPGLLDSDRGEGLWKTAAGPNNVSLEKCDLGKGAGVVDGAFAELPRFFADAGRVMDLETRLMWCMEKLQGFKHADLVKKPYPAGGQPVKDLGAIATYVAEQVERHDVRGEARPAAGKGRGGHGPCHLLPAPGPARFFLRHLPQRFRQAHSVAGAAVSRRSEGSQRDRRSVAGLPRLDHASDDHAAPALRLLLADADAELEIGSDVSVALIAYCEERRGW
jgi:sulfur-oxidizing protein SoxA